MSLNPDTPAVRPTQVPLVHYDEQRAQQAWAAYRHLLITETPELRDNPAWKALVFDALENFTLAFEVEA